MKFFNKKIITIISLLLILNVFNLFSSIEDIKMWERLYYQANSFKEKQEIMKSMKDKITTEFNDLIMQIVVEQSNMSFKIYEAKDYENLVIHTAAIAGKLKIKESTEYLKKIYEKVNSSIAKGEILNQIGYTENTEYLPWMNDLFRDFNTKQKGKGTQGIEEIIYGLILGISAFSDESSFEYLLYAAMPHYSKKIQELAETTINKITNDPAKLCNEIILEDPDYELKIDALNFALKSASSTEAKINTCKLTVNKIQWSEVPFNTIEKKKELLNKSVYYLGEMKSNDDETIEMIEKKWDNETDYYSILFNIEALQKIGTEKAAKVLIKKIKFWNDLKKEGAKEGFTSDDGHKIMIATLQALGKIKHRGSLEILYDTVWTDSYGNIIKTEALRAIDSIMNTTK